MRRRPDSVTPFTRCYSRYYTALLETLRIGVIRLLFSLRNSFILIDTKLVMGVNRCPTCHNTFSRTDHLKRHLLTHSDIRRFVCRTCNKGFNRKDAFRRHNNTCTPPNEDAANSSKRAVRRVLCQDSVGLEAGNELQSSPDRHVYPSPEPPWDNLIWQLDSEDYWQTFRGDTSQSLSLFVRTVSNLELHWIFDPELTLPSLHPPGTRRLSHTRGSRVQTWGLPSSVTMMEADDATASYIFPWGRCSDDENAPNASESYGADYGSTRTDTINSFQYTADTSEFWTPSPDCNETTDCGDCSTVSNEIMSRLRDIVCSKRSGQVMYPHEWNSQTADECYTLFGPDSLMRFTEEYWSSWYIHWPAIHRPTFRVSETPATLVASMVVLSTSYSSDVKIRELARCWADIVETMVFTDEFFGSATKYSALNVACLEERLRALQAGLAICVYQVFEGSSIAKRRARRSRFSDIVDMGRELGFHNGQHKNLHNATKDTFCWKEFILKEEFIRTLTYTVVLDSALGIMYNSVPKVMVEELETDLFCPEACFQASTESACLEHIHAWTSHPLLKGRRISFAAALKILSATDLDLQTLQMFSKVGSANLYVLATALHSKIFYIRNCILSLAADSAVLKVLRNWRRIWTLRALMPPEETFQTPAAFTSEEPAREERWRQTGFMKDALQFWLLAQIMLDSKKSPGLEEGPSSRDDNSPPRFDQPCMSHLKHYLHKLDVV
ncbi:hypothetical protein FB567DRAFT_114394 [Paraphoma chrysanthemicola]|uniref:C2H2-type domain-containing protein n=1 Tax=Paraphoma chrysanthemicola TaxID=798071 RepID=A0A8K0VVS0_9PLEO|nr:hypothetical protein FB567DRAFT_114394 [Paraphoma chrysanthemicola]